MSRINHLQRRDGRYWAYIRFDAFKNSGEHRTRIPFSLRTSDLRLAQYRLASIMPRILEFRIDPDRRRSAIRLQNWMLDVLNRDPALPATEQDLAASEALRQMVYNNISNARDAAHPNSDGDQSPSPDYDLLRLWATERPKRYLTAAIAP